MVCQSCGRREATVLVSTVVHNQVKTAALCASCAAELEPAATLDALMAALADMPARARAHPGRCPGCRTSFSGFRATGRFGCPRCYEHFASQVRDFLPRVHAGAYHHRGKTPGEALMQLQTMLRFRTGWAEAEGPEHAVVLSTRVRLARNLHAPFPSHLGPAGLKRVLGQAFAAARAAGLKNAAFFEFADLDQTDRAFLVERHLASPALAAHPSHRAVIVGEREELVAMINEEDHLRLAALLPGLQLREAHASVDRLDDGLSASLDFAFRDDLGYLTACPTNLGTGLRASCLVHLPALDMTGTAGRLIESLTRAGLIARGLYGEGTRVIGDFYQISNATGFGRTEGEILAALERSVAAIVAREKEARAALCSGSAKLRLEDAVHRSLAALGAARLLSFEEGQQHLSRLRLGLALGWKLPADLSLVNELTLTTQPAHLDLLAQEELTPADRDAHRAALVRRRLKSS